MSTIDGMIYYVCLQTLAILLFQKLKMPIIVALLLELVKMNLLSKLMQNIDLTLKSATL